MANTVLSFSLIFTPTSGPPQTLQGNSSATSADEDFDKRSYDLTTAPAALDLGNVSTIGYVAAINLGTQDAVLSFDGGSTFPITVPALASSVTGIAGPFKVSSTVTSIQGKTGSGTTKLLMFTVST